MVTPQDEDDARTPRGPLPVLDADGTRPRSATPFADVRLGLVLSIAYAAATALWIAFGPTLPGGRWYAVHLFTLGVLTNAILVFSTHFARTLTRAPGPAHHGRTVLANVGVMLLLGAMTAGPSPASTTAFVAGGSLLMLVVASAWWGLRQLRHRAVGARFTWVVRRYEDAHLAFLAGALTGLLLGRGLVPGTWYLGTRVAHLHANVLGWAGLTLLATIVFFGPTMVRTQIEPGADERAARLLRVGAIALGVALVLLVSQGFDATRVLARSGAALALAVLAGSATAVLLPVWRVARAARASAPRLHVLGVVAWFVLALWTDVAVVASGTWWLLDALGVVLLAGVLGQAILATGTYLLPILRGRTTGARERIRRRLDVGLRTRVLLLNGGTAVAAGSATVAMAHPGTWAGADGPQLIDRMGVLGLGLVALAVATTLVLGLAPLDRTSARPWRGGGRRS
jgi:hypothetical protein